MTQRELSVQDILTAIPRGHSIAVVGNGDGACGRGKDIDGHDVVVRFNDYQLGEEFSVGSRVSFRVANPWVSRGARYRGIPHFFPWSAWNESVTGTPAFRGRKFFFFQEWKRFEIYFSEMAMLVRWPEKNVDGWYISHPRFGRVLPSTGALFIRLIGELGLSADFYGFDFFDTRHYWNQNHEHVREHNGSYEEHLARQFPRLWFHGRK